MRVVCREGRSDAVVRYAWYFDDHGRQVREEDLVPGNPIMTRITETAYDLHSSEPASVRVYNGEGRLLESAGAAKPAAASRNKPRTTGSGTYQDYLSACEENPNALLHPIMGLEKEPQFFTKSACRCVAEKALRSNDEEMAAVWRRAKTMDPSRIGDRLAVAAMQNLDACLCAEAFPESRLETICRHAADIEKAWKP